MASKLIVFALLFVAIVGSNAADGPASSPMPATGGSSSEAPTASTTTPVAAAPEPAATTPTSSPSTPTKSPVATTPVAEAPDEETDSSLTPSSEETISPSPTGASPDFSPFGSPESPSDDQAAANALKISSAVVVAAIAGFLFH